MNFKLYRLTSIILINILFCLYGVIIPQMITFMPLPLKMVVNNLTIKKAIAIAHKHRPSLESFAFAIQASEYQAKEALSGYFPQISMQHHTQQSKGDKSPHSNTSIKFNQLVYKFGGPLDLFNVGKKETKIVELLTESEKQKIQIEVERTFLDAWLLQQQEKSIKSLHESSNAAYKKAEHQFKIDLLDKKDWLKNSADYAQSLATIDNYNDDAKIIERKLEFLLGERINVSIINHNSNEHSDTVFLEWSVHEKIPNRQLKEYIEMALENRPDFAINKKQIEIEQDRSAIARRQSLPWMEVFGQAAHIYQPKDVFNNPIAPRGFHQIGISINWNVFDGALSYFQASKFEASKVRALLEAEQTRQKISVEVEEAFYFLNKAETLLKAKDLRLIQLKNDLALARQNLEIGMISSVEFVAAQTAWEQENIAWLRQRVETEKSYRNLLFTCGYPEKITHFKNETILPSVDS